MKNKVITMLDLNNTLNYDREIEKDNILKEIKSIWDEVNYIRQLAKFDGGAVGRKDFGQKMEMTIGIAKNKLNQYKEAQFQKLENVWQDSDKLETDIQKMNEKILNNEYETILLENFLKTDNDNNDTQENHSEYIDGIIKEKIPLTASTYNNQSSITQIKYVESNREIKTIKNYSESYSNTIYLDNPKENNITQIQPFNMKAMKTTEIVEKLNQLFLSLKKHDLHAQLNELPTNPNLNAPLKQLGRITTSTNETKFKMNLEIDNEIHDFNEKFGEMRQDLLEISKNYRFSVEKLGECHMELSKLNKIVHDNGGVNCGWNSEDHQKFLKVSYTLRGSATQHDAEVVLSSIKIEIPMISNEQIYEHIERHKKYTILDRRRKQNFFVNNL